MINRLPEFFEGPDQRLSMTRLVVFIVIITSTILTFKFATSVTDVIEYAAFFITQYAISKVNETITSSTKTKVS